MILKIGRLAYSADVRATRLERSVLEMINSAILIALTPVRNTVDELTARVTACESRQGETPEVLALKVEIGELKKDIAYLKATNFTTLMRVADDTDISKTYGIPPTTIGDVQKDDPGHAKDLPNLVEIVVKLATQTVPAEPPTTAPSGSGIANISEATPETEPHDQIDRSTTHSECSIGSTRRWMLIMITCISIIKRSRPNGISTFNVRACEVLLRGTIRRSNDCSFHHRFDPLPSGLCILEQRAESVLSANRQRCLAVLRLQLLRSFQPLYFFLRLSVHASTKTSNT
uniref:Late blight resistance protein n=1 Tax=Solanum tuberosum TaxID=4113 RepID=M1DKW1_SOLTU